MSFLPIWSKLADPTATPAPAPMPTQAAINVANAKAPPPTALPYHFTRGTTGNNDISSIFNMVDTRMSPEQLTEGLQALQNQEPYKREQRAVEGLRDNMAAFADARPKAHMDLSPLYALANYETGGRFKGVAPAPDTGAKYDEILQKYGKEVADREAALNKIPYDNLQKLKIGTKTTKDTSETKDTTVNEAGVKTANPNSGSGGLPAATLFQTAQKMGDEQAKVDKGFDTAIGLIKQGNLSDLSTALIELYQNGVEAPARALVTELNKGGAKSLPQDILQALQYATGHPDEYKMTPEGQSSLLHRMQIIRTEAAKSYQQRVKDTTARAKTFGTKANPDALFQPNVQQGAASAAAANPTPQASPLQQLIQKWNSEK